MVTPCSVWWYRRILDSKFIIFVSQDKEKSEHDDKTKGSIDCIQETIGDIGRFQVEIALWFSLIKFPTAWSLLGIVFLAPPVQHWCSPPPEYQNVTTEQWRNMTPDHCHRYVGNITVDGERKTEACDSWEYDRSVFDETIITQWDLVCDRHQLANVAQTVFMFGVLLSNFFFGILADRFGRKLPLMAAILLQLISGVAEAFVTGFEMFLALRFLVAVATGGTMVTTFVLCMEQVGGWWRMTLTMLFHIPFSLGHMTLAALAYYARDWRTFQLAITLPSAILLIYWWTIPESPRWLLAVGREQEAITILERAAKLNKKDVSKVVPSVKSFIRQKEKNESLESHKAANVLDLFKTPTLRTRTLCMYFNWIVCGFCFYGLNQYMGHLGGNIFVNIAISGLIELPGCLIGIYLMDRFGRKVTLMGSQIFSGVACLFIMAVPRGADTPEWPRIMLAALGIVGMGVSFPTVYLYSGEVFPTVVRNVGVGSSSTCARIGSMLAPFVSSLGKFGFYIPPLLFGILPLLAGSLCILLPETANSDLPDTIEEGENFGKKVKVAKRGQVNTEFSTEDSQL